MHARQQPTVRLCFVCMGNICRSPMAAGIMQSLLRGAQLSDKVSVDSAGIATYHVGEKPDRRAREAALARGVKLDGRARCFTEDDFDHFEYVLAMDRDNRDDLFELAPNADVRRKVHLLRSFDADAPPDAEVPDPYYGAATGFQKVFDMCEKACEGLIVELRRVYELT